MEEGYKIFKWGLKLWTFYSLTHWFYKVYLLLGNWLNLPPPSPLLKSTSDIFELGIILNWYDPLKILWNTSNMKNVGTKSINVIYIVIFFAKIIKINIIGPLKMQIIHYCSVFNTLFNLGFFKFFRSESWDFLTQTTPAPHHFDLVQKLFICSLY